MKKIFTLVMCFSAIIANAQETPQIVNGDFEDWSAVTETNHAPAGWNSYETADELFIDDIELVNKSEWTFNDMLTVSINDQTSDPMPGTLIVSKQNNGKYTMTMKNFVMRGSGSSLPIGTITLTDVEGVEQPDGKIKLTTNQNVEIEEGDDPSIDGWFGQILCMQVGTIPVSLDAVMGEKLVAKIDIDLSATSLGQKIIVNFGDVADAIGSIKTGDKAASDVVYNLAGQRVSDDYKGIVVVKGRKILR